VGKSYSAIDDSLRQFIEAQPVFFVGSAPLDAQGHVNVSPKGLDTLRVFGPAEVAYLDLTGSGIETLSHVKENGRIVLMFCAFEGPPKIVRIYGKGRALEPGDAEFASLLAAFPQHEGVRAIIAVEITRIADSCGFGVPWMRLKGQRDQLPKWTSSKGPAGMKQYRSERNQRSIDGLPGLKP
jgi:hypothetical protein